MIGKLVKTKFLTKLCRSACNIICRQDWMRWTEIFRVRKKTGENQILYNTPMLTIHPLLSVRRCGDLIWAVWSKSKKIFRLLISLGNAENHQYVWSKDDLNLLEEILSVCLILISSASNRDGEKKISSPHHPSYR